MTFGFSRDDVEGRMMPAYLEARAAEAQPVRDDRPGRRRRAGEARRRQRGRKAKPDLKLGVCGEHGGDPESIDLFCEAGLDYVSCSPFRVPIARLAAAQAVLGSPVAADPVGCAAVEGEYPCARRSSSRPHGPGRRGPDLGAGETFG